MANYPIKMLKDEDGNPFVPLTHINAVTGEEYVTAVNTATYVSDGHFQIINEDLTEDNIKNKILAFVFSELGEAQTSTYIKLNNGTEYLLYDSDGTSPLLISGFETSTCVVMFTGNSWRLIRVGADSSTATGHSITDSDGNVMTSRKVLNFKDFQVIDVAGEGATRVINSTPMTKYTGIFGTISTATWTDLYSDTISAGDAGYYRVNIQIKMGDITSLGQQIGFRCNNSITVWDYQYYSYGATISLITSAEEGDSLTPQIYINALTSDSTPSITSSYIYIEPLTVTEVS